MYAHSFEHRLDVLEVRFALQASGQLGSHYVTFGPVPNADPQCSMKIWYQVNLYVQQLDRVV
jgi:hypothetical protein